MDTYTMSCVTVSPGALSFLLSCDLVVVVVVTCIYMFFCLLVFGLLPLILLRAKNFNVELPAVVAVRRGKYLLPESELFQQTARTAFDRGNITRFVSKSRLSVVSTLCSFAIALYTSLGCAVV